MTGGEGEARSVLCRELASFPLLRDPAEGGWCPLSASTGEIRPLRRWIKREPVAGTPDGMSKENDGRAISSLSGNDATRRTSGAAEDRNVALRKYARMRAEVPRLGHGGEEGREGEGR